MTLRKSEKLWKLLAPIREDLDNIDVMKSEITYLKEVNRKLSDGTSPKLRVKLKELEEQLLEETKRADHFEAEHLKQFQEIMELKDELERLKKSIK